MDFMCCGIFLLFLCIFLLYKKTSQPLFRWIKHHD